MSLVSNELSRLYAEIARVTSSTSSTDTTTRPIFTWNNTDYQALSVLQADGNLFGGGGLTPDNHLTVTVDSSIFGTDTPQADQVLFYKGREYRIDIIETSPNGPGFIMKCMDPNRAAGIVERETR